MKELIGHKNALLAFGDPAGAKAVLAFADAYRNTFNSVSAVSNRVYDFYGDFGFDVQSYDARKPQDWITVTRAQVLITGTSYPCGIELELIQAARRCSVPSISFVDHWINMAKRFQSTGSLTLPDWLFVIDDRARRIAIAEGLPEANIVVTGNPYHDFLMKRRSTKSRSSLLQDIGLPAGARYFLYAPEPLSVFGLDEKCGFDEVEGLKMILQAMRLESSQDKYVVVKAHPNQQHEVFEEFLSDATDGKNAYPRVLYLKHGDLITLIDHAECVLGFFSNSLVEANILGKLVIRPLMRLRDSYVDALAEFEGPRFRSVRDTAAFEQIVSDI